MDDKEFFEQYRAHQNESIDDYIARHSATTTELRDTISFLIHHREMIRDVELEVLEGETSKLLDRLTELKRQILVEELTCFKDVLAFHKQLIRDNDQSRD